MLHGKRINGIVGRRRSWLLALATLSALLAVTALTLAPARAAPPDDLALSLSLVDDSDNVVPAGENLTVAAKFSYTADAAQDLPVTGGTLRVSGSHEWEHNGRSRLSINEETLGLRPDGSGAGKVAVWQPLPSAVVVVVGAPGAPVDGQERAGLVDVYVNGEYQLTLTAPTPTAGAGFGTSVDVAGGYIVVGEPDRDNPAGHSDPKDVVGKAYVFSTTTGDLLATFTPSRHAHTGRQLTAFGFDVAISDNGNTIVVGANPADAGLETLYPDDNDGDTINDRERYWGMAYVFTKPSSGDWAGTYSTDGNAADHSDGATVLRSPGKSENGWFGGVDISGNGEVVAVGAVFADDVEGSVQDHGRAVVFERPTAGWGTAVVEHGAILNHAANGAADRRMGHSVALNRTGMVLAASASGRYALTSGTVADPSDDTINPHAGEVYVFVDTDGWDADVDTATGVLTDSSAHGDDIFGQRVAVSDSGDRILVADGYDSANDYQDGEAHVFDKGAVWNTRDIPNKTLTSPQDGSQLFFGADVAIAGENTAIIGQPEAAGFLDEISGQENIVTGPGRAFSYDLTNLAAAEDTASELELPAAAAGCTFNKLDDETTWTCPLSTEGGPAMITIPAGTPDGAFTISGSVTVDGGEEGTSDDQTYTASLEVEIGTVDEVAEVTFDFATNLGDKEDSTDDAPYTSTVPEDDPAMPGERGKTVLQLSVLNANGTASAKGTIASVLFTTTSGTLRLVSPDGGCGWHRGQWRPGLPGRHRRSDG